VGGRPRDRSAPRGAWAARTRDRELEAGTAAHYEDPAYYAQAYRARVEDVRYYAGVAERSGGPVLEYGCGNGRITLPIARAGVAVHGVDLSAPMLADLRARLRSEPPAVRERVTIRRGDMRAVRLARRFPLVLCPFNALLHLYARRDVEHFLARVRAHLAPRGELVLDVSMPDPAELARDPRRAYASPRFRHPSGTTVRYAERFDYDRLRQILFVAMEFDPADGAPGWMTPLAHRQFYPQELEALLHYNGFAITAWYGDFDRAPITSSSPTMVIHARARRMGPHPTTRR
jgi:SAM-dependent methyltransferase